MNKQSLQWDPFLKGLREIKDIIGSTYGPFGYNVSRIGWNRRISVDDGKQVLDAMNPADINEVEAVLRARDVADAQHDGVGDGTSTATLVFAETVLWGKEKIEAGENPHAVAKEIEDFAVNVCEALDSRASKEITEDVVQKVATIAMHGKEELGKLVGSLAFEVGREGVVVAEKAKDGVLRTERAQGYSWTGTGAADEQFAKIGRWNNPAVVVVGDMVESVKDDWYPAMMNAWRALQEDNPGIPLVVICSAAQGPFLTTWLNNAAAGLSVIIAPTIDRVPCKQMLKDLATLIGAKYFGPDGSVRNGLFNKSHFGRARAIEATMKSCSIVPYKEAEALVPEIIEGIEGVYEDKKDPEYIARVNALRSSSGVIYLPVVTETELREMSEVVEDGFRASMSVWDGYVAGGAFDLLRCALLVSSETRMGGVIGKVFDIQWHNAGVSPEDLYPLLSQDAVKVAKADRNLEPGQYVVGLPLELGLIEPLAVVKGAVKNAASVAVPLIRSRYLLIEQ